VGTINWSLQSSDSLQVHYTCCLYVDVQMSRLLHCETKNFILTQFSVKNFQVARNFKGSCEKVCKILLRNSQSMGKFQENLKGRMIKISDSHYSLWLDKGLIYLKNSFFYQIASDSN